MSTSNGEEQAVYPPYVPAPRRPDRPDQWRWPSPTPLPTAPGEDTDKFLKQILDRLDAIEKRLERIEKSLVGKQPLP